MIFMFNLIMIVIGKDDVFAISTFAINPAQVQITFFLCPHFLVNISITVITV